MRDGVSSHFLTARLENMTCRRVSMTKFRAMKFKLFGSSLKNKTGSSLFYMASIAMEPTLRNRIVKHKIR